MECQRPSMSQVHQLPAYYALDVYLARLQLALLSKSGGMRCKALIAPQCQPIASDQQRSSVPARCRARYISTREKVIPHLDDASGRVASLPVAYLEWPNCAPGALHRIPRSSSKCGIT